MFRAIYAGSFDPPHRGHIDVLLAAAKLPLNELIWAVGVNPQKKTMFSVRDRLWMMQDSLREFEDLWVTPDFGRGGIKITHFEGFLVDFAAKMKCQFIIRGLRNADDAKAELAYHEINKRWHPEIQTIFIPAIKYPHVSSSTIKEIASFGGLERIKEYVPASTYCSLEEKLNGEEKSRTRTAADQHSE